MNELEQKLIAYIETEQKVNVPIADTYGKQDKPTFYGNNYYHGYYNGYLTALFNIRKLITKNHN